MTLTVSDIVGRLSSLADFKEKADSGSTTTLVCSAKGDDLDDTYNNQYICFLTGANKGIDRIITDFATSTGTFTFDALDNAVDNTSEFAVVSKGYISYMEEGLSVLHERIKNLGLDIDLFLTEAQLKELHLYKTLDLICMDLFNDATAEDSYWNKHLVYSELFETTLTNLKADYDTNEDGVISEDEELQGGNYGVLLR